MTLSVVTVWGGEWAGCPCTWAVQNATAHRPRTSSYYY